MTSSFHSDLPSSCSIGSNPYRISERRALKTSAVSCRTVTGACSSPEDVLPCGLEQEEFAANLNRAFAMSKDFAGEADWPYRDQVEQKKNQ